MLRLKLGYLFLTPRNPGAAYGKPDTHKLTTSKIIREAIGMPSEGEPLLQVIGQALLIAFILFLFARILAVYA